MMVKSNKKKRPHENSGMPPSLVKLPPQFFSMIAKFYSSLQRIEDWFGCFPFPIAICIYPPILIVSLKYALPLILNIFPNVLLLFKNCAKIVSAFDF